ncbi:MAG: N-acetylglucosamine-6-phosphate deacetylase [Nocardioides sp.]
MLLAAARVVLPDRVLAPGWVRVEDGLVVALGAGQYDGEVDHDLGERTLLPGLVDMHVHGGGGAELPEPAAVAFHRHHGTTTLLASVMSAPVPDLRGSLAALRVAVEAGRVAGVHLEGPFLAPASAGAHDPAALVPPTPAAVAALLDAGRGVLRMVTLAPELDGGLDAVRAFAAAGVVVAVGHTDASYEVARAAVDAGATVATHLFNAMPPLHHREPGAALALLDDPRVTCEVIGDGVHAHPAVVRHVVGTGRAALVSDAVAAAGTGADTARTSTGVLAGSTSPLAEGLRRLLDAGVDLLAAVTAATLTPARALGVAAGSIEPGRPADLVVLGPGHQVEAVMARGSWVRRSGVEG